ncbi:MAG: wax ester/triacylglycerol synthase family O-acyltransferase [Pseudomonadales bacterium]|nr:wax ester/triacylglycerol synthase family O-acyltransferase [Pseudomonadales bacterium]MCP5172333.1 wax ester/triacylglycerol synthase family O-acyltransferase [Pseudomonadales bacterium]
MMKMADAGFLLMENASRGSHVSMLTTWELPKSAPEDFLSSLVARWRESRKFAEPFNLRVKPGLILDWETLSPDQIDLDYHLRHSALPKPGGERELGVLASRLHSHPLDRSRPLWEMHVIEGLENDRFAIFLKLHHSQIDGMGAIRLLERVLSTSPSDRKVPAFWEVPPKRDRKKPNAQKLSFKLSDITKLTGAVGEMMLSQDPDNAVPFMAPRTLLNSRLQASRRVATQLYDLNRLSRIAKKTNVSINDVVLNICAGALRDYFLERGELPEKSLTTGLPVSVREGEGVGNAISFVVAKLHTEISDPVERLQAIHRSTTLAKDRFKALPSRVSRELFGTLIMAPFIGQVATNTADLFPPVYNVVISNVPGPREALYLEGARMEAFYPISLITDGQALNITFLSYAGRFAVGFTACREAVPSMQKIAVATGEALDELEYALGFHGV